MNTPLLVTHFQKLPLYKPHLWPEIQRLGHYQIPRPTLCFNLGSKATYCNFLQSTETP